eukprot:gene10992-biopygen3540
MSVMRRPHATCAFHRFPAEAEGPRHAPYAAPSRHRLMLKNPQWRRGPQPPRHSPHAAPEHRRFMSQISGGGLHHFATHLVPRPHASSPCREIPADA